MYIYFFVSVVLQFIMKTRFAINLLDTILYIVHEEMCIKQNVHIYKCAYISAEIQKH